MQPRSSLLILIELLLVLTTALLSATDTQNYELLELWTSYKQTFKKSYDSPTDDQMRFAIWKDNIQRIQQHNVMADLGAHTFRLGLNQFADLTNDEYVKLTSSYIRINKTFGNTFELENHGAAASVPASVDWREKGVVTPIRDQGQCGSCWAFASSAALESNYMIAKGRLGVLSPQNLVDCAWDEGARGCYGGAPNFAFQYVIDSGGLDTEASYPYTGKEGKCVFNNNTIGATMSRFVKIQKGSESDLQDKVATAGPVAIGMDNSRPSFQLYKSGVYYDEGCTTWSLGHAMTVVGYGTTQDGVDYWIVKNSFGVSWGEGGYVRMSRNRDNNCGIATDAYLPAI